LASTCIRRIYLLIFHLDAVYFAARDPSTPMGVQKLAAVLAAYCLRPIDLVPTSSRSWNISMTC
jgi:uncharacterized membrane protein YkvA (DUF1232 family)